MVRTLRKIFFWTHLIIGLVASLGILIISVTGALLAFEPQIVEFAERGVRHVTPPTYPVERPDVSVLVAGASEQKPDKKVTGVTLKKDPTASVAVNFGKEGTLYVDPYTGKVLGGESKAHDVMHFIEDLHRFLCSKEIGKPILNACALAFLMMIPSGLYLWWPKKWDKKTLTGIVWFTPRATGKARDFNWHNVIGLWCAPVLLVVSATGVIIAYTWANDLLYRAAGTQPPASMAKKMDDGRGKDKKEKAPERVSAGFGRFAAVAAEKAPDWTMMSIRLPQKPDAPVTVSIQMPDGPQFFRSQLSLDLETAEEKKWEPVSGLSRGRVWRVWARYLHTGEALGWIGQLLNLIAALGGVLLVWTGVALSWRRFFGKKIRT